MCFVGVYDVQFFGQAKVATFCFVRVGGGLGSDRPVDVMFSAFVFQLPYVL